MRFAERGQPVLLAPVDVEDVGLGQPRDEPAQIAHVGHRADALVRVRVSIRLTPASRARRMTRTSLRRLQNERDVVARALELDGGRAAQ